MDNQMKQNQPEPTESLIDIAEENETLIEPEEATAPSPDYKEYISIELPTFKLQLGSSTRPVEFLAELLLNLKDKLNGSRQGKPGYLE